MARLVSWNYHQEDWNGKHSGVLSYMRFFDENNTLIFDTGKRSLDGRNNYESGNISGNFTTMKRVEMNWKRDLHSNGGGYWRLWIKDDLGNTYLALVSKFCKSGGNQYAYMNLDLGNSWDSGWGGFQNNWRLRRISIYNTSACSSVCNCNNGNCSCRGNTICNCHTGNCASYSCTCDAKCHSNCTSNNTYGCLCNTRRDAKICGAHCESHTCNCNSNKQFDVNKAVSIVDINKLRADITSAKSKFNVTTTALNNLGVEVITESHITNVNKTLTDIFNKVKNINPNFNYNYNEITETLPSADDKYIKLSTYKKMSDLTSVINALCTNNNTCPSNCDSYSVCTTRCTCNVVNNASWQPDGYKCPCNSQCSCNGQCSGVCSNCSCNAQNTMPKDCRIV